MARKSQSPEPAAVAADPANNPLGWTVEEWLTQLGVPLDKVRADLEVQAANRGVVGVPAKVALNIWNQHANADTLRNGLLLILGGLVNLSDGKGPHGHAGTELVG